MRREEFIQKYYKIKEEKTVNVYQEITTRKHIKNKLLRHLQDYRKRKNKILYLDMGCGTGRRTAIFINFLKGMGFEVDAYGVDLNPNNIKSAEEVGIKAILLDIEKNKPHIKADIITCFEVIEHIYDTDNFIKNVYNTLNNSGILLISTPNTVSWKNRIAMLLGVPPFNLEVSLKKFYGLKFFKKVYINREYTPVGHIRGFTPLSLKEMLEDNGFKVLAICGIENWRVTKFLDYFPSLATNFLVIAKKV